MKKIRKPSFHTSQTPHRIFNKFLPIFKQTEYLFMADGLRDLGSGLGVASIILIIVDKKTIISEAGLCLLLSMFTWYTSIMIINQYKKNMNMSTVVFEGTIFQMRAGFIFIAVFYISLCVSILAMMFHSKKKSGANTQAKN